MKEVSICDLYQFVSSGQNPDILKSLLDHQQEQIMARDQYVSSKNGDAIEITNKYVVRKEAYQANKNSVISEAEEEVFLSPERGSVNVEASAKDQLPKTLIVNSRSATKFSSKIKNYEKAGEKLEKSRLTQKKRVTSTVKKRQSPKTTLD